MVAGAGADGSRSMHRAGLVAAPSRALGCFMDLQGLLDRQPELAALFAPPAEPGAVAALQRELGLAVPDAFHALFGLADGSVGWESPYDARHLLADDGLVLHSLAEVRGWKRFWDDLARDFAALDEAARQLVFHHAFWHPDWIPLAQSGMGDVYALATTP
ncbi:SMI1/KNR4 family protein [Nannocystis bainbridge]|uniref:SMI1/KNR4 family protein n=1 Tax=Nannocystis bainbridge TaxID=2995303 RepID=A0ABT5EDF3_9BACT|nr:SMI1/KNR4 family protein [Nannocystis bainbridge]MDC0722806.1 SMI1/KNR4 family protein [Nannocystis bainbridge]